MRVKINQKQVEVPPGCTSLDQLMTLQGLAGPGRAVAVNNRVVPRTSWHDCTLTDGMEIVVISAVCGG